MLPYEDQRLCANFVPSSVDFSFLKDGASKGRRSDTIVSHHSSLEESVPVSSVSSAEEPSAPAPATAAVPAATPVVQHRSTMDGHVLPPQVDSSHLLLVIVILCLYLLPLLLRHLDLPLLVLLLPRLLSRFFWIIHALRCVNSPMDFGHWSIRVTSHLSPETTMLSTPIFMWTIWYTRTTSLGIR